jgi:hypothetical protein
MRREHIDISENLPPIYVNIATPLSHCPQQPPSPTASASRHSYILTCQLIKKLNQLASYSQLARN